jgi:hypothetical protein
MRFLYLIQGKATNVSRYSWLNRESSRIYGLTYDMPQSDFEYFPDSSFASGRNHLYQHALSCLDDFDYFIFIDDDVEFSRGSFDLMERNLALHSPSVGIPITSKTRGSVFGINLRGRIRPFLSNQRFHINDEQYLAFSKEVLSRGRVLPYLEDWDQESWFVCCIIQESIIQTDHHSESLQFNNCEILNEQHSGDYPQNLPFARKEAEQWIDTNLGWGARRACFYPALIDFDSGAGVVVQQSIRFVRSMAASLLKSVRNSHRPPRID